MEGSCYQSKTSFQNKELRRAQWGDLLFKDLQYLLAHVIGTLQTFQEVVVGFCPAVSVVGGEDPNRFFVCLEGGVPNLLQLNEELVSSKGRSITVVNIQLKELKVRRVDKDRDRQ